jgi:prepilin-type processing-associated H-X9-DG protein
MYADEATNELFPPLEFEMECNMRGCVAFGPLVSAVYPEYLTDPAIAFCPSDALDRLEDHYDANGNLTLHLKLEGNRQEGVEAIDASYSYLSYMLDGLGDDAPQRDLSLLNAFVDIVGLNQIDPQFETGPAQFVDLLGSLFRGVQPYALSNDPTGFRAEADNDRNVPEGSGNGGGVTVYRLREGIERFLITDINNPAAGARAQSELFVMWDNVATEVSRFNHVPGGCNVLYMDGHVDFVRYPGAPPVTRVLAEIMHVFDVRPSLAI